MTNFSATPGMVRLDIHTPTGKWYRTVALDMTNFRATGPTAEDAVRAAIEADGSYPLDEWMFSVPAPFHENPLPVLITPQAGPASGAESALQRKVAALQDLASTLTLYIGRHTWTQLTTEQKELLADTVDLDRAQSGEDDGYRIDRWWRG